MKSKVLILLAAMVVLTPPSQGVFAARAPRYNVPKPIEREACACKAAEKNAMKLAADAEAAFGKGSAQYANALVELGKVHYYQKNYDSAEKELSKALAIQERKLAKDDNKIAFTHGLLAGLYKEENKTDKADKQRKIALGMFEANEKRGTKMELDALEQMANLYMLEGNIDKSRSTMEEMIPLAEKQYGKNSMPVAQWLETLSLFNRSPERHLQGEELLKRAVAIRLAQPNAQDDPALVWDYQSIALLQIGSKSYEQGVDTLLQQLSHPHKNPTIKQNLVTSCRAAAYLLHQNKQDELAKRLEAAIAKVSTTASQNAPTTR